MEKITLRAFIPLQFKTEIICEQLVSPSSKPESFGSASEFFLETSRRAKETMLGRKPDGMKIFKGTLSGSLPDGSASDGSVPVVCKMAVNDAAKKNLEVEASFYHGGLQALQGKCVPHFYGLFQAEVSNNRHYTFLLLSLETILLGHGHSFPEVDLEMRKKVLSQLLELHRAGVEHTNFGLENVVLSPEGELLIIGFRLACEHKCEFLTKRKTFDDLGVGDWAQSIDDIECRELHDACFDLMDLWVPRYLPLLEPEYPISVEGFLCPEILADQVLEDYGIPREVTIPEVKKMRREFETQYRLFLRDLGWEFDSE
ncbi:unnamed protein product [Somion occarium]|uniref:Protein kinase domain-containing protein n=1 Tax=Somion occarium TaxID=3059160 RepID=A0ABP1E4S3_9APHY